MLMRALEKSKCMGFLPNFLHALDYGLLQPRKVLGHLQLASVLGIVSFPHYVQGSTHYYGRL
jgi:hypothetical protein